MLFISHSTQDKQAAIDLRDWLITKGYSPSQIFLDSDAQSGILAGTDWKNTLHDALKQCSVLIIHYSNHWRSSDWCSYELGHARALGKPIFPVLIEDIPIVGMAAEYQAVFYFRERPEALDRLWHALQVQHLGPNDTFLWPHPALNGDKCPFPGLPSFDERYSAVYFGRESETREVLDRLRKMRSEGEPRLLMIVGGSGSGKSSLLKAGVLPRLVNTPDWVVLPTLRFGSSSENQTLLDQLARNVVAAFPAGTTPMPDWKSLRDDLRGTDRAEAARKFFDLTQDLTMALNKKDATLLIAIDQFEEMLLPTAGQFAVHFLSFLHAVFARKNGRLLAIGTLRSDYLDVYEKHPEAIQAPLIDPWRLGPFLQERLADVIAKPAERAGIRIESDLLAELVKDTPTAEALPLLAFTLERLYRAHADKGVLTADDFKSMGGMEGAIQTAADRIFRAESVSPEARSAVRACFVGHLTELTETGEMVRRPARWSELPTAAHPVLERFTEERLLVRSARDREAIVEVACEALFRCWSTLRTWLAEDQADLRLLAGVRGAAREWDRNRSDDGLLVHRGARLAEAERLSGLSRLEMSPDAADYLAACVKLRERERVARERLRRRILIGLSAGIVISVSLTIVAVISRRAANEQRVKADEQRVKADVQRVKAERQAAQVALDRGLSLCRGDDVATGMLWLAQSLKLAPKDDEPLQWVIRANLAAWQRQLFSLKVAFVHGGQPQAVDLSQDGTTALTGSASGLAHLWDVKNGAKVGDLAGHEKTVLSVAFSPDQSKALTGSDDGTARLWDVAGRREVLRLPVGAGVLAVAFSPDGKMALTGSKDNLARLWELPNGRKVAELKGHQYSVHSVAFSSGGTTALTGSGDGVGLWLLPSGQRIRNIDTGSPVSRAAFGPKDEQILTGSEESVAQIWRADGTPLGGPLEHGRRRVMAAAFAPNGRHVVTGSTDRFLRVWDVAKTLQGSSGSLLQFGKVANPQEVFRLVFNSDGTTLLGGSDDGIVRGWDVPSNAGLSLLHDDVTSVTFSPNSDTIVTRSTSAAQRWIAATGALIPFSAGAWTPDDGKPIAFSPEGRLCLTEPAYHKTQLWDVTAGRPIGASMSHPDRLSTVLFSPDGSTIFTASASTTAHLWTADTGRQLASLAHPQKVNAAVYLPDGKTIVTASSDGQARIWEVAGGTVKREFVHTNRIEAVSISRDGLVLGTGSDDKTARLWDARTGAPIGNVLNHKGFVHALAFSPDGRKVATGSTDGSVRLWQPDTGQPLSEELQLPTAITAVEFSPDGRFVLAGTEDGIVQFWDVKSGIAIGPPQKMQSKVNTVAISPDGKLLVVGGSGGSARVWPVPVPLAGQANDLMRLVEYATGMELDITGAVRFLTVAEWQELKK